MKLSPVPVQIRFEKRLGSAITVCGTVALTFVIPSEAERLSELSSGHSWKRRQPRLPRKTLSVFRFPTSAATVSLGRLLQQCGLREFEPDLSSFGIETGKQFVS
jgi:hypothetical protein